MNCLHIVSNKEWGGGETYALDLCRALRDAGHRVAVVTRRCPEVSRRFAYEGFPVASMRLGGVLDIFSPVHIARMVRRFDTPGPVNIHVHNFKDAALALRVKRLCADREVRVVCTRHLVKPGKATQQALYDSLDALVFVSRRALDEFAKGAKVPPTACVIHNATDYRSVTDEAHSPTSVSAPNPSADHPCNILYIGRLAEEKGIDTLIEAAEMLTGNWHLRICGQGPGKVVMPLLRRCNAKHLEGKIEWPGHVRDLSAEFTHADIGVVPTRAPEAFGLAIVEMMQHGLAVVTTNNGAQPEIITDNVDGLLVQPDSPRQLAEALQRLIDDRAQCRRMGDAARATVANRFAYPDFFKRILALYR